MVNVATDIYQDQLRKAAAVFAKRLHHHSYSRRRSRTRPANNLSLMQCMFKSHLVRNRTLTTDNGSAIRRSL